MIVTRENTERTDRANSPQRHRGNLNSDFSLLRFGFACAQAFGREE